MKFIITFWKYMSILNTVAQLDKLMPSSFFGVGSCVIILKKASENIIFNFSCAPTLNTHHEWVHGI